MADDAVGGSSSVGATTATSPVSRTFPPPAAVQTPAVPLATEVHALSFARHTGVLQAFWRAIRLFFALIRLKRDTTLVMELEGGLPDAAPNTLWDKLALEDVCSSLRKAAHDPRICAAYLKIGVITCGYARLQEIRRYLHYFRQSGKPVVAFMAVATEKEYYVALGADEIYMPPEGVLSLRGFKVSGAFLRGVLDKIGIEPQVQRIGEYKSAGDQLARRDMSAAQREVLTSLLAQQYEHFCKEMARRVPGEAAAGHDGSLQTVQSLIDEAPVTTTEWKERGFLEDVRYEDEVTDMLKLRYAGRRFAPTEEQEAESRRARRRKFLDRQLRAVSAKRYRYVRASLLGLDRRTWRQPRIGVIRALGAISTGRSRNSPLSGRSVGSDTLVEQLQRARTDPRIAAVVLRIDSPGGSALASDLIWHEVRALAQRKPVVASMGDVAASGGYYIAMGCQRIVAEPLTLTGSIGVVTLKPSLQQLFERIGFRRETLSRGRYAELDVDDRPFTPEEEAYFARLTQSFYRTFVHKAAESRGRAADEFDAYAQGRVWSGVQALEIGLVDALGGMERALALCREQLQLAPDASVQRVEIRPRSRNRLQELLQRVAWTAGVMGLLSDAKASSSRSGVEVLALETEATDAREALLPWLLQLLWDRWRISRD